MRLTGGAVDDQNFTTDGRLEICFNNAWGSVCNHFFRALDAQVACGQLPGFDREGLHDVVRCIQVGRDNNVLAGALVVSPRAFETAGPIFLDELSCTESDRTLEGCRRGIRGIGLTTCNHTDDVWVQCSGTDHLLASEERVDLSCVFRY